MAEHREEIVHRQLDPDGEEPAVQLAEVVAELEESAPEELSASWETIDDVLGQIFSDPPSDDAQMEVTFSYEGYRITVEQDGTAKFVDTS